MDFADNQSDGHNHSSVFLHSTFRTKLSMIVLPTIFYVVFVVGLVGNSTVVYVMRKVASREKICDFFVINLAVADIMFLCFLPFWATEFALGGRWIFGSWFCKIGSMTTMTSAYGGIFSLVVMAADRMCAVVFHKRCKRHRTPKKAFATIVIIWMISLALSMIAFYFRDVHVDKSTGCSHCQWNLEEGENVHKHWHYLNLFMRVFVGFCVPLVLIVVFYIVIACYLKQRRSKQKNLRSKQVRATKIIFTIILMFIICWLPNEVSITVYSLEDLGAINVQPHTSQVHYYIHAFTTCLAWGHCCVNPFLYAFMRDDVQTELMKLKQSFCFVAKRDVQENVRCCLNNAQREPLQSPKQLRILKRTSELQLMPSSVGETVKSKSWSQASCCLEDNQMEFQKFYETIMSFGSHKATQNGCEVLED